MRTRHACHSHLDGKALVGRVPQLSGEPVQDLEDAADAIGAEARRLALEPPEVA